MGARGYVHIFLVMIADRDENPGTTRCKLRNNLRGYGPLSRFVVCYAISFYSAGLSSR